MNVLSPGTRSLLFGIHSIPFHCYYVMEAWQIMGWSLTWKDRLAIIVHDFGYFGLKHLGKEGSRAHVMAGALIMYGLVKYPIRDMVCHSSAIAHGFNRPMSRMGIADKLSMYLEPTWLYALRAWLTVEQNYYYDVGEERIPGEDGTFKGLMRFKERAGRLAARKAFADYAWRNQLYGKKA